MISGSELHWWSLSPVFPISQGTVVMLPVQLHRAAINLAWVSHNDSTGIRAVLTTLQEGLALCTDIFISWAASPGLTSLSTLIACASPLPIWTGSCSACFVQSFASVISFWLFFSPPTRNQGAVTQETDTHVTCTNSTAAPMSPWAVHWCDQEQSWFLTTAVFSFLRAPKPCCSPDLCNSSWMGASTGWKLQRDFHIKAALLFYFQLVIAEYLHLPRGWIVSRKWL